MTTATSPRQAGVLAARSQTAGGEGETIHPPANGPLLFVLSGPAGVGKDTIVGRRRERQPTRHDAVTVTTRQLRPGEADGVDYDVRSVDQLLAMRRPASYWSGRRCTGTATARRSRSSVLPTAAHWTSC